MTSSFKWSFANNGTSAPERECRCAVIKGVRMGEEVGQAAGGAI